MEEEGGGGGGKNGFKILINKLIEKINELNLILFLIWFFY